MIPARSEDPIEEITRSKAGGLEHDEMKQYMLAHYSFFEGGRLLITGLDVPRPGNNFTYVSAYSDSFAQGRSKPVNKRATSLVTACRHTETIIYGDAFLSRSFGNNANKTSW